MQQQQQQQTVRDNCISNQCPAGSKCVNYLNNFNCDCGSGYTFNSVIQPVRRFTHDYLWFIVN